MSTYSMYECLQACMRAYILYIQVCRYIAYANVCTHTSMQYIYIYMNICMHMYACIYVYMFARTSTRVYNDKYTYVNRYTHTYLA